MKLLLASAAIAALMATAAQADSQIQQVIYNLFSDRNSLFHFSLIYTPDTLKQKRSYWEWIFFGEKAEATSRGGEIVTGYAIRVNSCNSQQFNNLTIQPLKLSPRNKLNCCSPLKALRAVRGKLSEIVVISRFGF